MHVRDGLTGSDAIALLHQDAVGFESPSYRSGRARDRVGERGLLLARQVENGLNVPAVDDEGVAFIPPSEAGARRTHVNASSATTAGGPCQGSLPAKFSQNEQGSWWGTTSAPNPVS